MSKPKPEADAEAAVERAWARPVDEVLRALDVAPEAGLSDEEAAERRGRYGANTLRTLARRSSWVILTGQFKSLIIALLAVAAGLSFGFGQWLEGAAVVVVIAINAAIGFLTELKATRSMEALRKLGTVSTKVRRRGAVREIAAQDVAPGDIVLLEGGDVVTADMRIVEAANLQIDESTLTGESVPVDKGVDAVAADAPVAERTGMAFKGTAVTRGSAAGVVVATGMATEIGRISSLVAQAEEESTPLEKRLDQLGRKLIGVTLVIAVIVAVAGIMRERGVLLMVETAIALAVAAIPEGLPIVATLALARGMWRMARRNAIVNRLSSVETLGATSVIFTDKTGTLTENQMTVRAIVLESGEVTVTGEGLSVEGEFQRDGRRIEPLEDALLRRALEIGALVNNASLAAASGEGKAVGDPMEAALLVVAAKAGLRREDLVREQREAREEAFQADTKMMATYHESQGRLRIAVKGAPEAVIAASGRLAAASGDQPFPEEDKKRWLDRSREMAQTGLRMLALAEKTADRADVPPYQDLSFVALAALLDPPREEAREAIAACRRAGIRVIMVTGDQAPTAVSIAESVGLIEDAASATAVHGRDLKKPDDLSPEERKRLLTTAVFARVDPEQKLDLIELYQREGSVVAMTGDGVNDAPALKKADIGVAMGQRGTQVAREAADIVLKDDSFATIVAAVAQGRVIFSNIRRFVVYLLSCNISEIMTVFVASLAGWPLPILPLQILFLNLITDVFPALALGAGEGDPAVMERPPREAREPIVARRNWQEIAAYGALMTGGVLGALAAASFAFDMDDADAVTISFLTLALAQLWHVFDMRGPGSRVFVNDVTRNRWVWGAIALCAALVVAAVYVPATARVLQLTRPGARGWALALVMGALPMAAAQAGRAILRD